MEQETQPGEWVVCSQGGEGYRAKRATKIYWYAKVYEFLVWFFCNLGKNWFWFCSQCSCVSVSIRTTRMVELRENFCPFSVLLFLFAICLSLSLYSSFCPSLCLFCLLLFWLANNKGKLLLSQKFLTYKFSCFSLPWFLQLGLLAFLAIINWLWQRHPHKHTQRKRERHTHTLNNRVKAKTLIRPVICLQLAESLSSNYLCMQRKRQRKLRMPDM